MNKELLIIFTRNPELGKCKTRLASVIGDQAALDIYNFLLDHTRSITTDMKCTRHLYYSNTVPETDAWDPQLYEKRTQQGEDLGVRMYNAFKDGFHQGYEKVVIIGSDIFDLNPEDLENAFISLNTHDYVFGPAQDGGYYLLGMKSLTKKLFQNKSWGTDTVLKDSLKDITNEPVALLPVRNDIDVYDDIKDEPEFQPFLKSKTK